MVKDHGGSVEVYSDEGTYTLFMIKLPALEDEPIAQAQVEPAVKAES
jgi:nitrogen-specific signal transduction histidine kinase